MKSIYLNYGSLITLSTNEGFFLYSEGFIDSSPYLRQHSKDLTEFSGSVFRIVPQCRYSAQSSISEFTEFTHKADYIEKFSQMIKMEENLEGEIRTNMHTYNSLKGQVVRYNSLVQLEHLKSHKFLTLHSELSAEAEKDNFRISFEDLPSAYSHFRLTPSYKFQQSGSGCIKISDKVYFEILVPELRKAAWMHSSKEPNIEVLNNSYFTDDSAKETLKAIEVNVSLDQKTRWSIGIYDDAEKNEKHLGCGDYIWLNMPEECVDLIVDKKRWEVEKYTLRFSKLMNDTNGLWMIEYEDPFKGGAVREDNKYRLRHIVTRKYLGIKKQPMLMSKATKHTLWRFVFFNNERHIKSEELCYLVNENSGFCIKCTENREIDLTYTLDHFCLFKPSKANNEVIWEILFLLHCYPLLIHFPVKLSQYSDINNNEDLKKVSLFQKHNDVAIKCLNHLKLFVKNKLKSMIGIDNHFGEVQHARQLMLKQQHFIEALAKILESSIQQDQLEKFRRFSVSVRQSYKISKSNSDFEATKIKNVSEVVSKVYKLLMSICTKNSETQKHAYKFLEIYIKHVGLDLGASKFLISILRNNEEIMLGINQEERIDIIDYYVGLLNHFGADLKIEVIEFLKSICAFQGEAVSANQEKIFASLFKAGKTKLKDLIRTEYEGKNLYIDLGHMKISLLSCFESGRIIAYEPEIKYFTNLLQLYSNLCKSRNFESSALFIPKFPIDLLISMIWNNDLTITIRAAFCRLMLTMYIDCFMREEAAKPELIRIVNKDHWSVPQQQSTLNGLKSLKFSLGINILDPSHIVAYQASEVRLNSLLDEIYNFFESNFSRLDNELTYEILKIIQKLVKFQIFGVETTSMRLNKELGIVRIIKFLFPLILDCKSTSLYQISLGLKKHKNKSESRGEESASYTQYLSSIIKDASSLTNPIIRSAVNLKNYLSILKHSPLNTLEKKSINHRINLKVCKILEYYLDMRQDFLINNIIDWYTNLESMSEWKINELECLLPNIYLLPGIAEEFKLSLPNDFRCYTHPMIPDLQALLPSVNTIHLLLKTLANSDNYKLQTRVIWIILRYFNQRNEMLRNVKRLHIVFKSNEIELLNWVKSSLLSFKHHSEQSELWLSYWQAPEDKKKKNKEIFEKMNIILKDIENFMYQEVTIEGNSLSEPVSKTISKSRQEMLYYLKGHQLIITLIKEGVHKLATIYSANMQEELSEACCMLKNLFCKCYLVLKRFVCNNPRNQKKLFRYLPVLTQYLYLPLGQISLICHIYNGNLQLINTITEETLSHYEDLIHKYGRQKEFLKLFTVIQVTNNKPNHTIQRMVLSIFIKENLNTYMLYMNDNIEPSFTFHRAINSNYFYNDEPFEYHAVLLNVLSKCGYGASGILLNEVKCQQIISLKNIFKILFKCERKAEYQRLKIPMLDFFYNIYLDCEIVNLELKSFSAFFEYINMQCQVLEDLEDINKDWIDFLKIWVKILRKYMTSYIKKIDNLYSLQPDFKAIDGFVQGLIKNSGKLDGKISGTLIEEISELLSVFNEHIELSHDIESSSISSIDIKSRFHRASSNIGHRLIKTIQDELWSKVRETFIYDKLFKQKIEEEENALICYLHHSDSLFRVNERSELNFELIMTVLISFVRISRSQKPQLSVLLMVIKLFELIISRQVYCKDEDKDLHKRKMQDKLNFYGLTNVVLTLLVDSQLEEQIFKALISLSVELLDGGNAQIQQEFYHYFLTAPNSECFFYRISKTFSTKIERIAEKNESEPYKYPVFSTKKNSMKKILRFLQLLCENHNQSLQIYLRFQDKSHTSYNLIISIVSLLHILMKKKHFTSFLVISQCFETLTELIQGPCLTNQIEIANTNFLEIANSLLGLDESSIGIQQYRFVANTKVISSESLTTSEDFSDETAQLSGWMISHLKFKCLITILSLFEGRKDSIIHTKVIRSLSLEVLQENIKSVYISYLDLYKDHDYVYDLFYHIKHNENYDFSSNSNPQDLTPAFYSLVIENGFQVYHLLKTLQDCEDPDHQETLYNELSTLYLMEEDEQKQYHSTQKKISIKNLSEIQESALKYKYSADNVQNYREYLTKAAYMFFKMHTGNIEVIIGGEIYRVYFYYPPEFQGLTDEIKEYFHRHAIRESDQTKLKYLLDRSLSVIEQIRHEFLLKTIMQKNRIVNFIATYIWLFSKIAYFLTILLNLIILTSYSIDRGHESVFTFTPDDKGLGKEPTLVILRALGLLQLVFCLLIVAFFLMKVGPLLARKGWQKREQVDIMEKRNLIIRLILRTIQVFYTVIYVMSDIDVVYYSCYSLFSILGLFVHPFYFSLLLLDIIYRNPALQNVVNSIILPRKALLLTFLLLLVIVYIFSILGYWLLEDYFMPNCKSLLQCLLIVWDKSFKFDGGIGGFLGSPLTPTYDNFRFFYDNIYHILVMVVMMGVVQGIIIDTFARLREAQEVSDTDRENKCFICGLQRDYIEKKTMNGFLYHIENDHNEWNYILFLAYLLRKEPTEYTGVESYVREQFEKDELNWIPNQRALFIKISKQDDVFERIKLIDDRLNLLEENMSNLTTSLK